MVIYRTAFISLHTQALFQHTTDMIASFPIVDMLAFPNTEILGGGNG